MPLNRKGIIVHPEELREPWLREMKKCGLNLLGLHPVGGSKAVDSLSVAIDTRPLPEMRKLLQTADLLGIAVEYEAHAANWLVPRHLFSVHPEWFRMNENGERTDDHNFCVSNKDVLDYLSERAGLLASLLPSTTGDYMFWLEDIKSVKCHCPECEKLSCSDQQLIAANAMLRGIRRADPKANLCFLAYHSTMEVPTKADPEPGIFLEYAPIHRDCHKPLNDPDSDKNRAETATLKDLISFFGQKNSRALDYWMDNSLFSHWTKPPAKFELDEEVLRRDAEFYENTGFETVTSFGCYLGEDYKALYGNPPLARYGEILSGI